MKWKEKRVAKRLRGGKRDKRKQEQMEKKKK